MTRIDRRTKNPWTWVPSLYFAEGLPYVVVMTVSVIMYKRLGLSNTDIALYTSWLYFPWVIKPLWSPFVDLFRTKRFWIITIELILGAGLAGVAFTIPVSGFFRYSLAIFWLLAFSSATHDISIDGFYMLGLSGHDQAFFVGIRSTFYRVAMIFGQGVLIILAGYIESHSGLQNVEIHVYSSPEKIINRTIAPFQNRAYSSPGPMRIIAFPETLFVSTSIITKSKYDSLAKFVNDWNFKNSFTSNEKPQHVSIKAEQIQTSWLDKIIVLPLEHFLKEHFGRENEVKSQSMRSGNVGMIFFHLSSPPENGKNIVVNFGRESGENISLVAGSRFEFNSSNWNKSAIALVQLDQKLKTKESAIFEARSGNVKLSWIITFLVLSGIFLLLFLYHKFILPLPQSDKPVMTNSSGKTIIREFLRTFSMFFRKNDIWVYVAYILLYRFGEAQLAKMAPVFMLDSQETGGLALTTGQIGFVYGTIGIISLTAGGIIGGIVASRNGAKYWLWWMIAAINIPDLVYVYLSYYQTSNMFIINAAVALEQFGYGFGFTSFLLILIYISEGDHKTSHYALATGIMALGMMIPGMISGWLQSIIGYKHFFVWVCLSTLPAFILTKYIKIDPDFGKKKETAT